MRNTINISLIILMISKGAFGMDFGMDNGYIYSTPPNSPKPVMMDTVHSPNLILVRLNPTSPISITLENKTIHDMIGELFPNGQSILAQIDNLFATSINHHGSDESKTEENSTGGEAESTNIGHTGIQPLTFIIKRMEEHKK